MTAQTPSSSVDLITSKSLLRHQRQKLWQILLPIGLGAALALAGLVMVICTAVKAPENQFVSQWAHVSTIWMLMPGLMLGLIAVVLLFVMVWLLARLLKILPTYTAVVQHYARLMSRTVTAEADKLAAPIIFVKGFTARIPAFINSLYGRRHK